MFDLERLPLSWIFPTRRHKSENSEMLPLCKICQAVDFQNMAWAPVDSGSDFEIGTIQEIRRRAKTCKFCQKISVEYDSQKDLGDSICRDNPGIKVKVRPMPYLEGNMDPSSSSRGKSVVVNTILAHLLDMAIVRFQPLRQPISDVNRFCDEDLDSCMTPLEVSRLSGRTRMGQLNLSLAGRWLQLCQKHHKPACEVEPQPNVEGLRVIDVEEMTVVDAPQSCAYAALSYCWGKGINYTCVLSNKEYLKSPGALSTVPIPGTVRDSIVVTRATGIRFLWIDALCIVQDDKRMVQSQISKMATIYSQAVFTIVNLDGSNADSGLPGVRPRTRIINSEVIHMNGVSLLQREYPKYLYSVPPWYTRAWTMQEEIFSRRRLYFTANRISWVCDKGLFTEDEIREVHLGQFLKPEMNDMSEHRHMSSKQWMEKVHHDPGLEVRESFEHYTTLVKKYLRRNMTSYSDSLNAFQGIIQQMFERHGRQVFWGLPELWFSRALVWSHASPARQHQATTSVPSADGIMSELPFPSWSWSAWSAKLQNIIIFRSTTKNWCCCGAILFYLRSRNGALRLIQEDFDQCEEEDEQDQTNRTLPEWMGLPQRIDVGVPGSDETWFDDSGLLTFWTSVGQLLIYAVNVEDLPLGRFIHKSGWMSDATLFPRQWTSHHWIEMSEYAEAHSMDLTPFESDHRAGTLRFVSEIQGIVIGRTHAHQFLFGDVHTAVFVLLVEWKGDIAYRCGSLAIREDMWVDTDREWKQVTLG